MSQFWHANWAENAFWPKRLQNWQIPRWHNMWPDAHCKMTTFEADLNGRVNPEFRRSNPWGNFQGTWELPLNIDRCTAEKLSSSTENKKYWDAHRKRHKKCCEEKKCKNAKGLKSLSSLNNKVNETILGQACEKEKSVLSVENSNTKEETNICGCKDA